MEKSLKVKQEFTFHGKTVVLEDELTLEDLNINSDTSNITMSVSIKRDGSDEWELISKGSIGDLIDEEMSENISDITEYVDQYFGV